MWGSLSGTVPAGGWHLTSGTVRAGGWHTDLVDFSAAHHFSAPPAAVLDTLADPEFQLALTLPDLGPAELLEHRVEGDVVRLQLRYEYTGQLDARARRLLGGRHLTWVQAMRIDRAASSGTLHMQAEAAPKALHGQASFTVAPEDGGGSVRTLHGDLRVSVPVIGPMAERRIVPGLVARLGVEAAELDRRASGGT